MVLFIAGTYLNAYELPTIDVSDTPSPEIIIFEAQSTVVDKIPSYIIKWKTVNATDVNITFIGKVDLSGSFTITESEYNHGPITLMASSKKSKYVDSRIINNQTSEESRPSPIRHDLEGRNDAFDRSRRLDMLNNGMPYNRMNRMPYRRRRAFERR